MSEDIVFNAGTVSEALNDKVDLPQDKAQDQIDFVIAGQAPTEENSYTWYRKYKSGWVEQGGIAKGIQQRVITLPVERESEIYYPNTVVNRTGSAGNSIQVAMVLGSKRYGSINI